MKSVGGAGRTLPLQLYVGLVQLHHLPVVLLGDSPALKHGTVSQQTTACQYTSDQRKVKII